MFNILEKYLPNVVAQGWSGDAGWQTAILQTLYMTFWLSLIHISEPTRHFKRSRMPSSA